MKVCGRQREAPKCRHRLTELKQLHCWSWRTNSKQQEKLTQPRQEIITIKQETDRERGTERARETWQTHRDMTEGNGQLNIETRQAQITNTGDAGEDTQWQTQKGNRLNKQVTKN